MNKQMSAPVQPPSAFYSLPGRTAQSPVGTILILAAVSTFSLLDESAECDALTLPVLDVTWFRFHRGFRPVQAMAFPINAHGAHPFDRFGFSCRLRQRNAHLFNRMKVCSP